MPLQIARLYYGTSGYAVKPNDTLPLPAEFDYARPVECARLIMAIMSNASGGHILRDCVLRILPGNKAANITGSGVHVYYCADGPRPAITAEQALARFYATGVMHLGSVRTDQYGDGWRRAVWFDFPGPKPAYVPRWRSVSRETNA